MDNDAEILGVRIVNNGKVPKFDTFCEKDIFFIDTWIPKKNYHVPRFYTRKGLFTIPLTLEMCKAAYTNLSVLDPVTLINIKQISHVTEYTFGLTAFFENYLYGVNISRNKKAAISHLINKMNTRLDPNHNDSEFSSFSEEDISSIDKWKHHSNISEPPSVLKAFIESCSIRLGSSKRKRESSNFDLIDNEETKGPLIDKISDFQSYRKEDIYFIDMWSPKKNYTVPRFHTYQGVSSVPLTLDNCKVLFNNLQQFKVNLVNMNQIAFVTDIDKKLTAHFDNCTGTASIPRDKISSVSHLIKMT